MSQNLVSALLITAVGMGLVFLAILLLWWLMDLMVRLGAEKESAEPEEETAAACRDLRFTARQRAAAIAVACAIAADKARTVFPVPPTAVVSPWQSVMRVDQLKSRQRRGQSR